MAYHDFLWPPRRVRLLHPERFVLLFATTGRPFRESLETPPPPLQPALSPFRRNRLRLPVSLPPTWACCAATQAAFGGECALLEPGPAGPLSPSTPAHIRLARLVHQDIRARPAAAGQPPGAARFSAACPGDDRDGAQPVAPSDFSALLSDYFQAAFGPDGAQAQHYLEALGELLDLTWLQAGARRHLPHPT